MEAIAESTEIAQVDWQPKGRDYEHQTKIAGKVKRVFCSYPNFTAGLLYDDAGDAMDYECKFVLKDSAPEIGSKLTLHGKWERGKYGWQFAVDHIEYPAPDLSVEGLTAYLAMTNDFKGIGPSKAKAIAEIFGNDFDWAIREETERVAQVAHLSLEAVEEIKTAWCERNDINAISTWLAAYGVTPGQIRKIARAFGNHAQQVLTENPYKLHEVIDGIGFLRNDEIALKMGVAKTDPMRLRAGIMYLVNQESENTGHTYIERSELINSVVKNLYLDNLDAAKMTADQISYLCSSEGHNQLIGVVYDNAEYVGSAWLYQQEEAVYRCLCDLSLPRPESINYESIENIESVDLKSLTSEQQDAVKRGLECPVSIITGGAGTGKSHTISRIKDLLTLADKTVEVCAPTGKAARRLQSDGIFAQTIHRLLEYSPVVGGFTHNEDNPLEADCIIIDEVSMCAVPLLYSLCKAIDFSRTRLILVGDYNQLPPIGPGNTLRDCVDNNLVPTTRLTVCHRNAGQLKTNCVGILDGKVSKSDCLIDKTLKPDDSLLQGLKDNTPAWSIISDCDDKPDQSGTERVVNLLKILQGTQFASWGFDPLRDCQIITPQNPGPLGVNRLNLELQRVEQLKRGIELPPIVKPNERPKLLIGDKVMQTSNDYKTGLMNGTQGVILDIINEPNPKNPLQMNTYYVIQFDDRDAPIRLQQGEPESAALVLAYAVTCHKVQGSQYPCVVAVVHRTHSYMLSRNLFYTAVTRAKYCAIILGEPMGIARAARITTNMERRTWTKIKAETTKP